jgi:hypothetical protein
VLNVETLLPLPVLSLPFVCVEWGTGTLIGGQEIALKFDRLGSVCLEVIAK